MATSSYIACAKLLPVPGWLGSKRQQLLPNKRASFFIAAQQQSDVPEIELVEAPETIKEAEEEKPKQRVEPKKRVEPRPAEKQLNVQSKNMTREFGGQWLSSVTRHVRIYAAYIDPDTCAFDQTQTDKLTLLLDTTNEFLWTDETCNMVYSYFQELVDHYEGAPLTEYTLRLIGSDIEHYIRKLLYDGLITYNLNSRVLNFSMGKPRIQLNNEIIPKLE